MKVLVFTEQRAGKLKSSALEALSAAANVAGGNSADVAAVLIGQGTEGLAAQLQGYGADKVFVVDDSAFQLYNCLNYTKALEEVIKKFSPDLVLGIATPMGKDLFPRIAARLNGALVTDVVSIGAGAIEAEKPMYAGKVTAKISIQGSGLKLMTLRQNVFPATKSGKGSAAAEKVSVAAAAGANFVTKEIRKGSSEKPDLTEASVIISGGRAMGNADNFKVLHACADVIGATVGASRAAVDSGYAPHDMQVGQTGKTVNPNLYIACGISGSIQHMAGMRTSKVIVAVNTDPEAPIFGIANYGIVADLFQAVPEMTKKFKEIL